MDKELQGTFIPLTVPQLISLMKTNEDLLILDTRSTTDFTEGFVPGAVFIGYEGKFAEWAANLLSRDEKIVVIADSGREQSIINMLVNEGFHNIEGYLEGGFEAWKNAGGEIDMVINIEASELAMDIPFDENLVVVDVRKPVEYAEGHIEDALNIPLADIKDPGNIAILDERHNLYIHCARGYRSVIAASLLKRQGYNNLRNIVQGWDAIKETKGIKIIKEASALN